MKKLFAITLTLFTFLGFAQQMSKEEMKDAMKERLTKRERVSPEKRASIQTKRMALALDLSKQQQSEVESALTAHFQEEQEKINSQKKSKKDLTEDERHQMLSEKLDAQIALKEKMKNILNDEQYAKYSQMMDRRMQKGPKKGMDKKAKKRY